MDLAANIYTLRSKKNILLMTHLVLGYPSFEVNRQVIRQMVTNGVDLIELQIPFSEPIADGPMILKANQDAVKNKVQVRDCINFAAEMTRTHNIPFLFMTYYNIIFKYGVDDFIKKARDIKIKGFIIPDLPPEEGTEYLQLMRQQQIAPVQIFAPTSTSHRMRKLAKSAEGFIYCVARRGVTGAHTTFDQEVNNYLSRCRNATNLPLAVGFGISSKKDIAYLTDKADIAVIGTATIKLLAEKGVEAVGTFVAGLK